MLDKLAKSPKDFELRRQAAEAIDRTIALGAERTEIDKVLSGFVNLTGHDDDAGLPCLCRECLPRAGVTAEAQGSKYFRSFVIAGTRVLHFWMLEDVSSDRTNVRASVHAALLKRLLKKEG